VDVTQILELLGVGLAAGILGDLLGIGGSIIIIPLLSVLLHLNQHLAQAVAMIINIFVAVPAMVQHQRAGAIRWDVMRRMLPLGIVFILIGVLSSNQIDSEILKKVFGVFLLYMIVMNVRQLIAGKSEPQIHEQRVGWIASGSVGAITGFMAGLLGIGGGNIAVPLLQRIAQLPLRQCIATTAAFMCVSASAGAIMKNASLSHLSNDAGVNLGLSWIESVKIAAVLAPTAIVGGLIGGKLTHTLPLKLVRVAFILLLTWACLDMLKLI
jgi:uncharacterized membrane protein YfcA